MQYRVEFTLWLDSNEKLSDTDVADLLDATGIDTYDVRIIEIIEEADE